MKVKQIYTFILMLCNHSLGRQCELNPPSLKIQDAWANPYNEVGKVKIEMLSLLHCFVIHVLFYIDVCLFHSHL